MSVAYKPRLYTKVFVQVALANLFTVSSFGIFFIFPLYLKDKGGTEADIGIIMGTFALSSVLCRPWISEIIDRLGRKRSYAAGAMLMGIDTVGISSFKRRFWAHIRTTRPVQETQDRGAWQLTTGNVSLSAEYEMGRGYFSLKNGHSARSEPKGDRSACRPVDPREVNPSTTS